MIVEHIVKKKKSNPIGILIADQYDGAIHIGFSLCCKTDTFNETEGLNFAIDKMSAGIFHVPHSIERQFKRFTSHAIRYYRHEAAKTEQFLL